MATLIYSLYLNKEAIFFEAILSVDMSFEDFKNMCGICWKDKCRLEIGKDYSWNKKIKTDKRIIGQLAESRNG